MYENIYISRKNRRKVTEMSISSQIFRRNSYYLYAIEINKDGVSTSEYLAGSVNTNPAVMRKIIGMLKKAELVKVRPGVAGAKLAKELIRYYIAMFIKQLMLYRTTNCLVFTKIQIRMYCR